MENTLEISNSRKSLPNIDVSKIVASVIKNGIPSNEMKSALEKLPDRTELWVIYLELSFPKHLVLNMRNMEMTILFQLLNGTDSSNDTSLSGCQNSSEIKVSLIHSILSDSMGMSVMKSKFPESIQSRKNPTYDRFVGNFDRTTTLTEGSSAGGTDYGQSMNTRQFESISSYFITDEMHRKLSSSTFILHLYIN